MLCGAASQPASQTCPARWQPSLSACSSPLSAHKAVPSASISDQPRSRGREVSGWDARRQCRPQRPVTRREEALGTERGRPRNAFPYSTRRGTQRAACRGAVWEETHRQAPASASAAPGAAGQPQPAPHLAECKHRGERRGRGGGSSAPSAFPSLLGTPGAAPSRWRGGGGRSLSRLHKARAVSLHPALTSRRRENEQLLLMVPAEQTEPCPRRACRAVPSLLVAVRSWDVLTLPLCRGVQPDSGYTALTPAQHGPCHVFKKFWTETSTTTVVPEMCLWLSHRNGRLGQGCGSVYYATGCLGWRQQSCEEGSGAQVLGAAAWGNWDSLLWEIGGSREALSLCTASYLKGDYGKVEVRLCFQMTVIEWELVASWSTRRSSGCIVGKTSSQKER